VPAVNDTFHLEVNTTTGDVSLWNDSTSTAAFTIYNIVDNSRSDLLIGNPADANGTSTSLETGTVPYTNELFLSVPSSDSNAVPSITGRSSTNYKAWSLLIDGYNSNGTALALSEAGKVNKTDTINVPSDYSIDLGDIFNVHAAKLDLTFEWGTETTSGSSGGDVYNSQPVDYVNDGAPVSPTLYWKNNAASGNWSGASNWSSTSATGTDSAGLPTFANNAAIANTDSASHVVTLDVNGVVNDLQIGSTGGGTDTLSQTSAVNLSAVTEEVGSGGVGIHSQSAGTNTYGFSLSVGSGTGGVGTYDLSGSGSVQVLDNALGVGASGLYVGNGGNGTFIQTGGFTSTATNLYLSYNGAGSGTYLLSGGSLNVAGNLLVGSGGNSQTGAGAFIVSGGSLVVGGSISLANGSFAQSGGSTVVSGPIGLSNGSFSQSGGSTVVSGPISLSNGSFSQSGGLVSAAQLLVSAGSSYNLGGGTLVIGGATVGSSSAFVVGSGSSAATLNLGRGNGTFNFANGLSISQNSSLIGGGTFTSSSSNVPVTVSGTLEASAPIDVNGSLTLNPSAATLVEVGSFPFNSVTSTNNMSLGGLLSLDVPAGAAQYLTTFSLGILSATDSAVLSGGFSNIVSGQRITTTDDPGSVIVTVYDGVNGFVKLSGFQPVTAPNFYWKSTAGSNNWSNGSNWSAISPAGTDSAGVPAGTFANVYITDTDSASRVAALDQSASFGFLQIGNTGGGTDTLSQPAGYSLSIATELVGAGTAGVGVHNQSAGVNTYSNGLFLGFGTASAGTYGLSGNGAVNITGTGAGTLGLYVGYNGNGTFLLSGGTLTTAGAEYIGGSGIGIVQQTGGVNSAGTLDIVNGGYFQSNGTLIVTQNEYIAASNGSGTFNQVGGYHAVIGGLQLGQRGATGTYLLGGGTLVAEEVVGYYGLGTFSQTAGLNSANGLQLGYAGGTGTYLLSGGTLSCSSSISISAGNFIQSGGSVTAGLVTINSGGTLSLSGGTLSSTNTNVAGNLVTTGSATPINVTGAFSLTSTAGTLAQLVGSSPSFADVQVNGSVTLAGTLSLFEDSANEAITGAGQTFIIFDTINGGVLSGSFANISNGQTLTTTDGTASYLVTIVPGTDGYVELSDFTLVPEPGSIGLLGMATMAALLRRNRRRLR
jgi:hypothetical protein